MTRLGITDREAPFPPCRLPAAHPRQVPQRSLFRYPGGKSRLTPHARRWLRRGPPCRTLVEPFAGGASISLAAVAENLAEEAVLIEIDPDVAHVWRTALEEPEALARAIAAFGGDHEALARLEAAENLSAPDRAVRTIALNRMRFNGIMARRAGTGALRRWYRDTLVARLQAISDLTGRIRLIEGDGVWAIRRYGAVAGVRLFVDPPYERTGSTPPLYVRTEVDHQAVFAGLRDTGTDFLMTYGDTSTVRRLVREHGFSATTIQLSDGARRTEDELVITRGRLFA